MKRVLSIAWPCVVACLLVIALADGGVLAASSTSTVTADGASSCIWTYDGFDGSDMTVSDGQSVTLRIKCYLSDTASAGTDWLTDGAQLEDDWAGGESHLYAVAEKSGSEFAYAQGATFGGANRWEWSAASVDVWDDATNYIEFSMVLTNFGTTETLNPADAVSTDLAFCQTAPVNTCSGGGQTPMLGDNNGHSTSPVHGARPVESADFSTSTPAWRWHDEYSVGPAPFCNGTTVELDAPTTDSTIVSDGDTVHTVIDLGATPGTEVQVKFRTEIDINDDGREDPPRNNTLGNGGEWHTARGASYAGADPADYDFVTDEAMWPTRADRLLVRCREPSGAWVVKEITETGEGQVSDSLPDRPCRTLEIYAPDVDEVEEGESTEWFVKYPAAVVTGSTTILDLSVRQGAAAPTADPADYGTFESVDTNIVLGTSDTYTVVAERSGRPQDFMFWRCTDSQGVYPIKSFEIVGGGFPGGGIVPGTDAAGCVQGARFGFNPSSWAPALLGASVCLARAVVIPSDSSIDSLRDAANEATTRAPISYVVEVGPELYNLFDSTPAAVSTHRDDCLVMLPPGLVEGAEVNACPEALDSLSHSSFRTIIGGAAWVGFAWLLWNMTMRLIAK
jgi:hypothetical protein